MADSLYFYDLETSGINPRESRVMQFAGQRTDLDLNPIGEPHNILITLSEDVLPDPDAILITGITPQQTQAEGTTEYDFLQTFAREIATPGTIFVGYNTVRFDDEFMRCLHWRNFHDPYQWQWKDDRSRWDLLDVVRMTRALRPEGIKWPVDSEGRPTNRLELLSAANKLEHSHAHDALSDVRATIALAQLLRGKQSKLFDYLLKVRDKQSVRSIATAGKPFVYSSGKYSSQFEKTTVVEFMSENSRKDGALVYDLRWDPTPFATMSADELVNAWAWQKPEDRKPDEPRLPIKTLKYNRCPAVAPLAVLDQESQQRLKIDMAVIEANRKKLAAITDWPDKVLLALDIMDGQRQQHFDGLEKHVDGQIYDGFLDEGDNKLIEKLRNAQPDELADFVSRLHDKRLKELLPLYKARNFPRKLNDQEKEEWEQYKSKRLFDGGANSRLQKYFARIQEIAARPSLTQAQRYILEDLTLYGQSLMPADWEN
ncbi:exodeoxyribonuclease I [Candidatus Saccharibacteria bacterium]|nr:MAG: exodeoxyribonuclease I [Candidatus Saccharibacteria bacterium]